MSNGKMNALVIISLIIGASGLGVGIFSMLRFQVVEGPQGPPGTDGQDGVDGEDGSDGVDGTLNNMVGLWESVYGGPDFSYTLNYSDNKVYDSNFIDTSDNKTINMLQPGWYRVYLSTVLTDLDNETIYVMVLYKNGVLNQVLVYLSQYLCSIYMVDASVYVYNDGDDYFDIRCYCPFTPDSFGLAGSQYYNQFVVEYVKEI